jgi:hypothetical protein
VCEGFCSVDVAPSPKAHDHDVGPPVDVSVNRTARGAVPLVGVAAKLAVGACVAAGVVADAAADSADRLPAASTADTR